MLPDDEFNAAVSSSVLRLTKAIANERAAIESERGSLPSPVCVLPSKELLVQV